MPKINVYLPDDLAEAVKEAGVPVSAVCQRALEQAVRRVTAIRAAALGEPGSGSAGNAGRLSDRARTALKLASERAAAAGTSAVGTGHLLAGIMNEGGNLALPVLRAIDIEPAQVQRALAELPAGPDDGDGPPEFGTDAVNALELATTEAIGLGHNYVGCEHLLLGLVAEPDGAGGQVLRSLGAEPRLTRRAVAAALAGYVHLRAQTSSTDPAAALAAAVQEQLKPVLQRLDRLEARMGQ